MYKENAIMGFKPEPTRYTLKFEDTFLDGLIIKVGCCSVAEFHDMIRRQAANGAEVASNNDHSTQLFLDYLIEWNLENSRDGHADDDGVVPQSLREGQPTPHTLEGVGLHEQVIIREVIGQWQKAMAGMSDDLGKDSPNGNDSQERSLGLG
jgi:hypothetical protein